MQIIALLVAWRHQWFIPISTPKFVYNGTFDIARSVRNSAGSTLLRDLQLMCDKPSAR